MRSSTARVTRGELALLVALVAWGLFPLVLLLVHASSSHTRLTGADGLIGADGELGGDQLQYLAWVRDASAHGLAADLFRLTDIRRVYLQPLFTISGGLYRLGLPLSVAYLVFKPVAIVVLGAGTVAWARRMEGDRPGARAAIVALSLFSPSRRQRCSDGRTRGPAAWGSRWRCSAASCTRPTSSGDTCRARSRSA